MNPEQVEFVPSEFFGSTARLNNNDTMKVNGNQQLQSSAIRRLRHLPFVNMFRGSANYIARHRNTVAVYHIPGSILINPDNNNLRDLMNDIALTWLLGMQIVLVAGCREQMQARQGLDSNEFLQFGALQVTDAERLRIVKEEAGFVRFELERQLARALRMQADTPDGNVVSGNFYSAQPLGVMGGIDYQYTGFVRRLEVEKIRAVHQQRDICLLSTLGVSPSGEVFNVNSEALAAVTAATLQAAKVIYFCDGALRHKKHGTQIQSLRYTDARKLIDYHGIQVNPKGFISCDDTKLSCETSDILCKIAWCAEAIRRGGVQRAHLLSPQHGALLQELYTRDGSGTLIAADVYEGIRQATVMDVASIHTLIAPLVAAGTLVDRPKTVLEKDVQMYYVYTRDSSIVACGQLKVFENGFAEIGCLVVNQDFRSSGRGDAMLGYLERLCLQQGCTKIFVLSTQTMEWFVERGFDIVPVEELPPSRQATYNRQRASKIYMKTVESDRDLDASELFWT